MLTLDVKSDLGGQRLQSKSLGSSQGAIERGHMIIFLKQVVKNPKY